MFLLSKAAKKKKKKLENKKTAIILSIILRNVRKKNPTPQRNPHILVVLNISNFITLGWLVFNNTNTNNDHEYNNNGSLH